MGFAKDHLQVCVSPRCCETIAQDYAESATIHGISYIGQREQAWPHRLLWLLVVFGGVAVAVHLSTSAYTNWQEDPIITSVRTTALPIEDLEYPAITICGQGMSTDTLDRSWLVSWLSSCLFRVLKEQFNSWLRENGIDTKGESRLNQWKVIQPIPALTPEELDALRRRYEEEKFPGLELPMDQVRGTWSPGHLVTWSPGHLVTWPPGN